MSETRNEETQGKPASWDRIAVVILAGFTVFLQSWAAFNGNDVKQNERLAGIERVLCATDDKIRRDACRLAGITPT